MTEEILLVRDDNKIPWGFRLTGGRDFNSPLTVARIHGQSIAENRGLKVGDIITEINNHKTNNLCHSEAQRFIADCGNFLKFIVLRGSSPAIPPALTPVRGMTPILPNCNFERKKATSTVSAESVYSLYEDDSFEFLDQHSDDEYQEFHEPTEEEINQMLLENAEVIEEKGKNVIGVNFKRFIPKCEFIKDSAVFQVLQEEQVYKELSEKEQLKKCPNKRFSTFLAPPDRPVPQPKPKPQPDSDSLLKEQLNTTDEIDNTESTNTQHVDETQKTNEEKSEASEVTLTNATEDVVEEDTKDKDEHDPIKEINNEVTTQDEQTDDQKHDNVKKKEESAISDVPKTEFEVQLDIIKNTLNSLEQLPSLIQSQLTAIQNQINQLTQLKDNSSVENNLNDYTASTHDNEYEPEALEKCNESDENVEIDENFSEIENIDEMSQRDGDDDDFQNIESTSPTESNRDEEISSENIKVSEEEEPPKRRPGCPLTPLPRPVVLPGGRIWRKPKDAYNEEFIAETLISQAEVLVGSTVGVNFRKYEPPKFDLSNSAVYKLIHNIENKQAGLQERDTIPSLQDYYQSPISARHFYCANLANRRIAKEEETTEKENESDL